MQAGSLYIIRSTPAQHFTEALAQNAESFEALTLPAAVGAGKISRAIIRGAIVLSYDNLDWEFNVWTNLFGPLQPGHPWINGDINQDSFRGRWQWVAADGVRIAGTGLYRYYIDGLQIVYEDETPVSNQFNQGRLFLSLVNRSAAAKTAYSSPSVGGFQLSLLMEPTQGW